MGLDLYSEGSNNEVHMSYSGFFRIREVIADAMGLPLHFMEGFLDVRDDHYLSVCQSINDIKKVNRVGLPINWKILKYDPLYNLINHSDCDGTLSWRIAGRIAKRLKEIKDKINFKEFNISEEIYEMLIKLFEDSKKNKKKINFY